MISERAAQLFVILLQNLQETDSILGIYLRCGLRSHPKIGSEKRSSGVLVQDVKM